MLRILTATSALALAAAIPAVAQDGQKVTLAAWVQEAPPELGPSEVEQPVTAPTPASQVAPEPMPIPAPEVAPVDPAVTPIPAMPAPVSEPIPVDPVAAPAPAPQPIAAAEPSKEQKIAQVVDAEFASYDGDGDGNLTKAEFSKWIIAMRDIAEKEGSSTPVLDKPAKTQWANAAFTVADSDKSKKISKVEMSTYLLG